MSCDRCGHPLTTGGCVNSACPSKHWTITGPVDAEYYRKCPECTRLIKVLEDVREFFDKYPDALGMGPYNEIVQVLKRHGHG
jgi:hypothetical protein